MKVLCKVCNWYQYDPEKYTKCFNCTRDSWPECDLCIKLREGLPINRHDPKYSMCMDCSKLLPDSKWKRDEANKKEEVSK